MPIYCTTAACARKKKQATYGVQGSRKKQWCGTCAKEHGGVRLGQQEAQVVQPLRRAARGAVLLGKKTPARGGALG